ncbi:MAG: hypothetical protein U0R44_02560 [Candidatus Micrarchaeia archaeon]
MGPYNGTIRVTLHVAEEVKVNQEFDIIISLAFPGSTKLSDKRKCIVIKEKEGEEEPEKGKESPSAKPNYHLERIYTGRWGEFGWNELKVGQFSVTQDANGTDLLLLRVNMDSALMEGERKRMQRFSRSEKYVQRVE